jgi:hypothetical protein
MAVLSKSTRNTGESGKNIVGFGDRRPEYSQERDTTVPCMLGLKLFSFLYCLFRI